MKLIALQDLPNGVKAGTAYEERDGIAAFLIAKQLARKDEPVEPSDTSELSYATVPPRRRSYTRRDLPQSSDE